MQYIGHAKIKVGHNLDNPTSYGAIQTIPLSTQGAAHKYIMLEVKDSDLYRDAVAEGLKISIELSVETV